MSLMIKSISLLILMFMIGELAALTLSDAQFCLQKELWGLLDKNSVAFREQALSDQSDRDWLGLYLQYCEHKNDTLSVMLCLEKLALQHDDLDSAVRWISTTSDSSFSIHGYPVSEISDKIIKHYNADADRFVLQALAQGLDEDSLYASILQLTSYNDYVEELAKALVDMIAIERDDSLSFALTQRFRQTFPNSKWDQAVYYYELTHLIANKQYPIAIDLMDTKSQLSPAHSYLAALFLSSPTLRRNLIDDKDKQNLLGKAAALLETAPSPNSDLQILYDNYTPDQYQARMKLQQVKVRYYRLVGSLGFYGDEDSLQALLKKPTREWKAIQKLLQQISFANNDTGELAELNYWQGRLHALLSDRKNMQQAAKFFTQCLVYGAPRRKYDVDASQQFSKLHTLLQIKASPEQWQRQLLKYKGIVFEDVTASAGFIDNRETRVALGDCDNDGFADVLLNGRRLFCNNHDLTFTELSDSLNLAGFESNGGLFADFNLDGKLDLMTISHDDSGAGERLMKNQGDRFVCVNERAGDIDDSFPTEGAAWIDCFIDSYPDLYCTNYEKWQERSGYEDRFWNNASGYFSDQTRELGFLLPDYTHDPGQAGRGVAPADFDNDGRQEILVTNYRLCRNFLWDLNDSVFVDVAALNGVQGNLNKGYYGHSIGADWGDFDNDGDLDLFIANLAHPRYIEISDVSQLLRNDGVMEIVIEGDTISYWQFTDITKQAGITYDELHSDPLWFDADNDGWLDLFITSVYENDRSYLYHNNSNGTFTDITWLAGARVYNGWGNAAADLDHDGRLDLVVGSGNGTRILHNKTSNKNRSISLKPVWVEGRVSLLEDSETYELSHNSPAFGTRVILNWKPQRGKPRLLIRELSSAKGTTSQNDQILHFGLGQGKVIGYKIFDPDNQNQ